MRIHIAIFAAAVVGIVAGLGGYTFKQAEGLSYFSTDPRACANCHIMREQYDSWQKSSHHTVARCIDCHLPHDTIPKYLAKAENGYFHSKGFTLLDFHEPIMIKPKNSRILQEGCVSCHDAIVHDSAVGEGRGTETLSCVHCHASVGHGPTR
jgi:cytochrome c nitrite reductase small subunit